MALFCDAAGEGSRFDAMNHHDDAGDLVAGQVAVHPFARDLDPSDVEVLQGLAEPVEFGTGAVIFEAGGPADTFYLIRTGLVALEMPGPGMARTIQTIAEGSALGWSWLFPPYEWQFSAVARTPVRGVAIDAAALRDHLEHDKACGYRILSRVARVVVDRLQATRIELLDLTSR